MPLEGQSSHSCFCSFLFVYFSGKLYFNCANTQASQVFSLGVSSYPRLETIGTCHSAWVTSVADKALFYLYYRLTPLFPCVYIIACCSVAFDLAYYSANNFYLICFLQFCERHFHFLNISKRYHYQLLRELLLSALYVAK